MLGIAVYICFGLLFVSLVRTFLWKIEDKQKRACERLRDAAKGYKERFVQTVDEISNKDEHIHRILALYEINRKLAYILEIDKLIETFIEELSSIHGIDLVEINEEKTARGYSSFMIDDGSTAKYIHVKSSDRQLAYQVSYLISQLKILIDRALIYQKMQKMSVTDYLTNIANRRYFMERFRQEFQRTVKFSIPLSFMVIDIDHFKKVNDTYGHLVGDEVLRQIADVLSEKIREIDFIGRYGGEEFVVFLPEADKKAALKAGERLRECIENTVFKVYDEKLRITVSIGLSTFPSSSADKDNLVENADKALFKAKKAGRNKVVA